MDEIILLGESLEAIKAMPDKDAGALLKALIKHMEGEEPDRLPAMANMLYPLIKGQVDRINALNKKNRENGKKGGRPKKTQTEPKENPNITQMKPNTNPDNDNDNDIEKIYKKEPMKRNPKIQKAYGFSTERTDIDYNEIVRKKWEEAAE